VDFADLLDVSHLWTTILFDPSQSDRTESWISGMWHRRSRRPLNWTEWSQGVLASQVWSLNRSRNWERTMESDHPNHDRLHALHRRNILGSRLALRTLDQRHADSFLRIPQVQHHLDLFHRRHMAGVESCGYFLLVSLFDACLHPGQMLLHCQQRR